jgi:uncharacterized protein (TIGR03086 family)
MTEIADRYRRIAGTFTQRVSEVPADAWDNQSPVPEWTTRDVVRHLVDWVPGMLSSGSDLVFPTGPSVDDDPLGAWTTLSDAIQAVLDDPATADKMFVHDRAGTHQLDQAIGMFVMSDVLMHTWDLARAAGLDDTLDAEEVAGMYEGMLPLDDMLRQSGQYGPRVDVPDDAPVQDKLMAFVGRQP